MAKERVAFIRVGSMGLSVLMGTKDTVIFNPGEVIPVHEEFDTTINTITADGVNRTVQKEYLNIFDFDTEGAGFLLLEDAIDIVETGMKLFLHGKSIFNLPANSKRIFDVALGVVTDFFMNNVFDGTD